MNCPEDIQEEDDFFIRVALFWDRVALVNFFLQFGCAIVGAFIVFCSTKRDLRPNFVTIIWALIIVTCVFLTNDAIFLWLSIEAQSEE